MHKPESVIENEPHKIICDFEIQTYHQIPARKLDLESIRKNKRTGNLKDFVISADHRVKIKGSDKIDKNLYLVRELKNKK